MPPPSTASSTTSGKSSVSFSEPLAADHAIGAKRNPPLQPPKPMFFLDRVPSSDGADDLTPIDPFRSPDVSVPGTPKSVASNPFSAPSSVINFSAEQTPSGPSHGQRLSYFPESGNVTRSRSSRVSVHSTLRNETTDLDVQEVPSGVRGRVDYSTRDSFMSPPVLSRRTTIFDSSAAGSRVSIAPRQAKRARSTMLTGTISKPWLTEKDVYARLSYFITYAVAFIGVVGAVLRCYFGWKDVPRVGNLCLVMEDDFNTFDTDFTWQREVDMGGFGNGEFEMTTNSDNNSFVKDGHLYIVPTLTSDIIGYDAVMNGYTFNISGCTNTNTSACGAVSNRTAGTVINPVQSARITTRRSHSIQYGKVEVVARIRRGDWLWPAIWMLPVNNDYGPWPLSGEIDIMEARGNSPLYKAQGVDVVRGSLNWGPLTWLNGVSKTYGWWTNRRQSYDQEFHTYSVEWTPEFIRIYVDTRLHHMLELSFNEPFFDRGDFPLTVANGSAIINTPNPWINGTKNVAPFDKPFYLIINLAVGGTNGWFPDNIGDKPWLDGSPTAMQSFASQQATWSATWPQDIEERSLVVDSVKMWQTC